MGEEFTYMQAIKKVYHQTDRSPGCLKLAKTLVDAAKVIGNVSTFFFASDNLVFVAHNPVFDTFTIHVV